MTAMDSDIFGRAKAKYYRPFSPITPPWKTQQNGPQVMAYLLSFKFNLKRPQSVRLITQIWGSKDDKNDM